MPLVKELEECHGAHEDGGALATLRWERAPQRPALVAVEDPVRPSPWRCAVSNLTVSCVEAFSKVGLVKICGCSERRARERGVMMSVAQFYRQPQLATHGQSLGAPKVDDHPAICCSHLILRESWLPVLQY